LIREAKFYSERGSRRPFSYRCKGAFERATYACVDIHNHSKGILMRSFASLFAAAAMASALFAGSTALAAKEDENADLFVKMSDRFMKMSDMNKDGMLSKAEAMKMFEKMYDKHDTKKQGMLDRKQTEAFLAELMKGGG
jgi:hypothetical protein